MKKLYYLRHSRKDAENNISPEGIELAKARGQSLDEIEFTHAFVGPLARTQQTASAFFLTHPGHAELHNPIPGIGNDTLFKKIATDEFKAIVGPGKSNFEALMEAHYYEDIHDWMAIAYEAVCKMFDQIEEGQTAIAFGHSPMIELAAYYVALARLPVFFTRFREMDGLVFGCTETAGIQKVVILKGVFGLP